MNILLVAATEKELLPFMKRISHQRYPAVAVHSVEHYSHSLSFLITGVGGVATAVALSAHLVNNKYDLIINVGIAGSFRNKYKIGDAVLVSEEIFADLGVEEADGRFLDLFEVGLVQLDSAPFDNGRMMVSADLSAIKLPLVRAISVNRVHGSKESINSIVNKYDPDIESMEGAAFFYSCHCHNQVCMQLRTVSNFIEPRDREKWNIPLAIESLAQSLDDILRVLI